MQQRGATVTLEFVRHARSEAQELRRQAGEGHSLRDAAVSASGKKQAELLAKSMRVPQEATVLVVASPLRRALETAALLRKGPALASTLHGRKVVAHPGLAEHGDLPENHGSSVDKLREDGLIGSAVDFSMLNGSSWPEPAGGGTIQGLAGFAGWLVVQDADHIVLVSHKVAIETMLRELSVDIGSRPIQNCVPFRATMARKDLEGFAKRHRSAGALAIAAPPAQARGSCVNYPRLIVLSGLPGSGKSTFARALMSASEQDEKTGHKQPQALVVSSDEDGKEWGAKLEAGLRAGRRVIVDRCCPSRAARREVLDVCARVTSSGHTSKHKRSACATALVYFDVDAAECKSRTAHRTLTSGHPTVKAGKECKAVSGVAQALQVPAESGEHADEFDALHILRNGDAGAAACLMSQLGFGRAESLPLEVRRLWSGLLTCDRALVFYPPLDAPAVTSIRDLHLAISKCGSRMPPGAGAEVNDGAAEEAGALLAGAIPLRDVHVTLMSAAEIKASGVPRAAIASFLEAHPELCAQAPTAQTDAIPRLGISGAKKTAFLAMRDQEAWRRFREAILTRAAAHHDCGDVAPRACELNRDFHVSWWNSARKDAASRECQLVIAADAHDSIGALTRTMDPRGKTFKSFFGVAVTLQEKLQASAWAGPEEEPVDAEEEMSADEEWDGLVDVMCADAA